MADRELFYTWQAEEDLAAIFLSEAAGGRRRAMALVESIESRCTSLLDFPMQGRARDDLRPGLRVLPYGKRIVIAYKVEAARIVIARFFHGGQDYERLILDPGD